MTDTRERAREFVRGEGCKCAPDHLTAFAESEAATRYKQAIAGNPSYCTWPTYKRGAAPSQTTEGAVSEKDVSI